MKILYAFLAAFLLLPATALAQRPGGTGSANAGRGANATGSIYGKVVNSKTGKPVDGASVLVLAPRSAKDTTGGTLAGNALTEGNGEFMIEDLPAGKPLQLILNVIGYAAQKTAITLLPGNLNKDLGNIPVVPTTETELKEVEITAQTPQFELRGEKKIFNVDQNLSARGGMVTDVLRSVPGVQVDADGNVTIRNSGPQIFVDGRQTTLSLDQIPADAVENLEIINNPSARYDAAGGGGGILNIVLKKNRKQGYNGNVRAGGDSRGGANLDGDLNIRSGKFNFSVGANGRRFVRRTTTLTDRTDLTSANPFRTSQDGLWQANGYRGFSRLGVDYFMTNRTSISLSANTSSGEFNQDENIDIWGRSLGANGVAGSASQFALRTNDGRRIHNNQGISLGGKHLFPQAGRELTVDMNYNQHTSTSDNIFQTDSFNSISHEVLMQSVRQRTTGSGTSAYSIVQADYVQPISKTDKLELGVKGVFRNIDNENNNFNFNTAAGDFTPLPNPFSNYSSTDRVLAAYVSYSGNVSEKTGYQLGLRAESSAYEGELAKTGQSFSNSFPISFFPSAFVSQQLTKTDQLQLSYRRGIDRPDFWQLFPFADYTDPLNIRQGNAALKPAFTNSLELTYLKSGKGGNYASGSAYYRRSDGVITAYQSLEINPFTNSEAVVSTYANLGNTSQYGLELTTQYLPRKWWTIVANVNGYNAAIVSDSALTNRKAYLSAFAKLNNTFKLQKGLTIQVLSSYQSRTSILPSGSGGGHWGGGGSSTAQGYIGANWTVDASVRKAWGKSDALSLTLSVNDIFGTQRTIQHTENAFFVQDYNRLSNPYTARLNLAWRFGERDVDLFRRKTRGASDGGGGGEF